MTTCSCGHGRLCNSSSAPTRRRFEYVPEVGQQAVGDIDTGRGQAAQRSAQAAAAARGTRAPPGHVIRRVARTARTARACAAAPGRPDTTTRSPGLAPERVKAWPVSTRPSAVTQMFRGPVVTSPPDRKVPRLRRQPRHAACERVQPLAVGPGQGHGEEEPGRFGAHGREVAEVHGQGLVTHCCCRGGGGKVHALDQAVGANDQLPIRGQLQDGGIVADTENALRNGAGLAGLQTISCNRLIRSNSRIELRALPSALPRRCATDGPPCRARR